jgi:hypothetical protein
MTGVGDGVSRIDELQAEFEAEHEPDEYFEIGEHRVRRERRVWGYQAVCVRCRMRRNDGVVQDFRAYPCEPDHEDGDRDE